MITELICFPVLKYRQPQKSLPLNDRQAANFYREIVSSRETFLVGDAITGHRPASSSALTSSLSPADAAGKPARQR